jgi:RNA polymerase sigma-70 factor (ECF subfamily)
MLHEAALAMTTDDLVRRLLLARLDDAHRLATFILRDRVAAEDAVQDAALLAWDRRRSLRDAGTIDGWFTRILVNTCRDELRRRARRPRVVTLDLETARDSHPDRPGGDADLGGAIARLNVDEQALLALRFGRELTVPAIAGVLDVPEGTVKSRLHSTLGHLRAALDAERRAGEDRP